MGALPDASGLSEIDLKVLTTSCDLEQLRCGRDIRLFATGPLFEGEVEIALAASDFGLERHHIREAG